MWVAFFCLFLKVSGKELGRLGLRFLIHLGVVSDTSGMSVKVY
jgi:hypothetical protein